jgi:hypothetical protein
MAKLWKKLRKFAKRSLDWLSNARDEAVEHQDEIAKALTLLKTLGVRTKELEKTLKAAIELEQTYGAATEFWDKLARAEKRRSGLELTKDEVVYAVRFKRHVWDRLFKHFKKSLPPADDYGD